MTLEAISRAEQQVARTWLAHLPSGGWDESELFWARLEPQQFCQMELISAGRRQSFRFPAELHANLAELRRAMGSPEQGCWFSVTMKLSSRGSAEVFFNWDRRFYLNGLPTLFDPPTRETAIPAEQDYLAELEFCPRAVEFWPAWLAVDGAAVPNFRQPAALPPALAWLEQDGTFGWPAMVSEARACIAGNLRQSPRISPVLLGREGPAFRQQALHHLLRLSVECELKTLHRSSGEFTLKLWREWASRMNRLEPAGLSGLVFAAPLGELPPSAALTQVVGDVTEVLTAITAALIGAYFQTTPPRWSSGTAAIN